MENEQQNIDIKTLWVDEVNYKTTLTKKYLNRKPYKPPNVKEIKAFIPGTIREVFVKRKAKVKANDKLLILEAMKMKNVLRAPVDGAIKSVNVKVGQSVSKNHILIEFA